jgi:hypothetical protein
LKLIIKDVKESDEEIFNQLSNFLQSMIFDVYYLVEIDTEKFEESKEKEPESV